VRDRRRSPIRADAVVLATADAVLGPVTLAWAVAVACFGGYLAV
jgi:hypothetical protein